MMDDKFVWRGGILYRLNQRCERNVEYNRARNAAKTDCFDFQASNS
jgi:hypothetical protein